MTSPQLEALKALVLAALAAAAAVGLVAANVATAFLPVVAAVFVALAAFLVHPPQSVEQAKQNAAVASTVHDVATSGVSAVVDVQTGTVPVAPGKDKPVVASVYVKPIDLPPVA